MPREPLSLEVAVPDVSASVPFYEAVFQAPAGPAGHDGARCLTLRNGVVLRVAPESGDSQRGYQRGSDVRLELRVPNVDAWLAAFLEGGAALRCRLARDAKDGVLREAAPDQAASYAQVIDPFGHRWAIAADDRPEP